MKNDIVIILLMVTWVASTAFAWCLFGYSLVWWLLVGETDGLSGYMLHGILLLIISSISEKLTLIFMRG